MSPAAQEQLASLWMNWYSPVVDMIRFRGTTPEEAEDITMAAFARLGEKLEKGTAGPDPALLRTIAEGIRVDRYRAAHPQQTFADGTSVPVEFISFDALKVEPEDEVVQYRAYGDCFFAPGFDAAMRGLDEADRAAFALTELRGLTTREAADVLGTYPMDISRRATAAATSIREELA